MTRQTDELIERTKQLVATAGTDRFEHRGDHPVDEAINLLDGEWYRDEPHATWKWMRDEAPIYHDPHTDVWAVTRYDDLLAVEKDAETFSNKNNIRPKSYPVPMMISMDDPDHLKRRKLVNKGFTPKRVRDQEAKLVQICDDLIDSVIERGECDFVWDVAAHLPLIVIGDMLGVLPEDRGKLLEWSDILLKGTTSSDMNALVEAGDALTEYMDYQLKIITERREHPTDDLVSVLVHAEVDGDRLDEESLLWESLLILIGGDETTRHVISGGLKQLLTHPDQKQKLIDDPSKIVVAVEEMLRWVSPIKTMSRLVTKDVELNGQHLREGDELLLFYPSANRDERVFDDPNTFDVERAPNNHLAFGFGTHFCLGNSLARLELKVLFERLLARLPDIELAVDEAELPRRASSFISGFESLPVRFNPAERINS